MTLKQNMCENLKFFKAKLGDIIFETDPVRISYVVKEDFKIHVMSTYRNYFSITVISIMYYLSW